MASYANGSNGATAYTLTALNRWSIADRKLPAVDKIKTLHVYDFDNTLFNSPLPNPKLWNGPTIGLLQTQDTFSTGGWWHNSSILGATGEGVEKEEPRAWEGWWNEKIVELIQLSMDQKDAICVLLTGRSESGFSQLIKKMLASKGLVPDMIVLKPVAGPNNQHFSSTMKFKQAYLESLMETYGIADEIRIYEDRPRHVKEFKEFFFEYNKRQHSKPTRGAINAEVVQVADGATQLDPVAETVEVQRIINEHNAAVSKGTARKRFMIKKTVFYTGYLISNTDTQKLLTLANLPPNMPDTEMKFLANNVLITPRPCPNSILEKVGGMGSKTTWQVTGTAVFENKIWAALVQPVPASTKYYTENREPIVVLALRKGARPIDAGKIQNWQPVAPEKAYVFDSTVGEKVLLRIEEEDPAENEYESLFPNKSLKRKHAQEDENINPRQPSGSHGGQSSHNNQGRGAHQQNHGGAGGGRGGRRNDRSGNQRGGRGGRGNGSGGGGGGGGGGGRNKGRGGGGGAHYRSLDDVGERSYNNTPPSYNVAVAYEDFPPLQKQYQTPQQLVQQQFEAYNQYQQQQQAKGNKGGGGYGAGDPVELQYS